MLVEQQACLNLPNCARDCKVGEWGEWSGCSVSCGGGAPPPLRVRKRVVLAHAEDGGAACPAELEEVEVCAEEERGTAPLGKMVVLTSEKRVLGGSALVGGRAAAGEKQHRATGEKQLLPVVRTASVPNVNLVLGEPSSPPASVSNIQLGLDDAETRCPADARCVALQDIVVALDLSASLGGGAASAAGGASAVASSGKTGGAGPSGDENFVAVKNFVADLESRLSHDKYKGNSAVRLGVIAFGNGEVADDGSVNPPEVLRSLSGQGRREVGCRRGSVVCYCSNCVFNFFIVLPAVERDFFGEWGNGTGYWIRRLCDRFGGHKSQRTGKPLLSSKNPDCQRGPGACRKRTRRRGSCCRRSAYCAGM